MTPRNFIGTMLAVMLGGLVLAALDLPARVKQLINEVTQ